MLFDSDFGLTFIFIFIFLSCRVDPDEQRKLDDMSQAIAKERILLDEMIASLSNTKKVWSRARQNSASKKVKKTGRGKKSKKKQNFGAKVTEVILTEEETKNPNLGPTKKKTKSNTELLSDDTIVKTEQLKNSTANTKLLSDETIVKTEQSENSTPLGKKKPSFRRLKTSENGREYYQNADQPEVVTWTVPADAEFVL